MKLSGYRQKHSFQLEARIIPARLAPTMLPFSLEFNGRQALTTLSSWGPTLVLVVALLLAGGIGLRVTGSRTRAGYSPYLASDQGTDALRIALSFAEVINAYDVSSLGDPRVHLGEVVRLAPKQYQEAALEIPRHFREGNVVSVDLSRLSINNAARLVDYCSGLLSGTSGWLFRATDRVIVLTPARREHN